MRNTMPRRSLALRLSLAALAAAGFATEASAHAGSHAHMTFGELANHLAASMDHRLAILMVVLFAAVAGATAMLARRSGHRAGLTEID
jgi:hypothetical protein